MKRLYIILCFIVCFFAVSLSAFPQKKSVKAENNGKYLRVIEENVPFFADEQGLEYIFNLPYTYYVKLLAEGEILSKVEYGALGGTALIGYVPTKSLYNDDLSVISPYPNLKIKTLCTTILYSDSEYTTQVQYIFSGREMTFLGSSISTNGVYACFVEYNGRIGYVKDNDIIPFNLENHPNELTFLEPEPEPELIPEIENEGSTTKVSLKYVIIACLLFAGVLSLLLVFRKTPATSPAVSYYDENDYE